MQDVQPVERDDELRSLRGALADAAEGRPRVFLVCGDSGIGKTLLVEHVAADVEAVMRSACFRLDGSELPYAPLSGLLRDAEPGRLSRALNRVPPAGCSELARAFPMLPVVGAGGPPVAEQEARRLLFESVLRLLGELSVESPLLIIIEDVQWVDRSSGDFIRFLVRWLRHERIVCMLTYRTRDLADDEANAELVRELPPDVTRLTLGPLSPAGVAVQAERILGSAPGDDVVAAVYARSQGNPFYAEELLAASLAGNVDAMPESIAQAALPRLRRQSRAALHVLERLAVLARPADPPLLNAMCDLSEEATSEALREALDAHVLAWEGGDAPLAFRHELLREMLERRLLPSDRRQIHAATAEALAATGAAAAELVRHWQGAGRPAETRAAAQQASRDAHEARAFADAVAHADLALSLWDDDEDEVLIDRLELMMHVADSAKSAGDYRPGVRVLKRELARLGTNAPRARLAVLYQRLGSLQSSDSAVALAEFQCALELMPVGEDAARSLLHSDVACALWGLGRLEDARCAAQEALDLAHRAGGRAEIARADAVLGLIMAFAGNPKGGDEHLARALRDPDEGADAEHRLYTYLFRGEVLRLRGQFDDALAVMDAGRRVAGDAGLERSFGRFMTLNGALDAFMLGRWDEVDERLTKVEGALLDDWSAIVERQVSGWLALVRGDFASAREALHHARRLCARVAPECRPLVYAGLAELEVWDARGADGGRLRHARDLVQTGLQAVGDKPDLLYRPVLHTIGARVEADIAARARAREQRDEAEEARDRCAHLIRDLEGTIRDGGQATPPTAAAHLTTARAELARIDRTHEVIAWREAATAWDRIGLPYPATYARLRLADAMVRSRVDREVLRRVLTAASETADRLEIEPLRASLAELVEQHRIALPRRPRAAPVAPTSAAPFGLTPAELHVLSLLAEGRTNREIAVILVNSEHTVRTHVSHILKKLGARTRAEAATTAYRAGLIEAGAASG